MIDQGVGERLNAYLKEHKLLKTELAELTGIPKNTLTRITKGYDFYASVLIPLARHAEGFDLYDFLFGDGHGRPNHAAEAAGLRKENTQLKQQLDAQQDAITRLGQENPELEQLLSEIDRLTAENEAQQATINALRERELELSRNIITLYEKLEKVAMALPKGGGRP